MKLKDKQLVILTTHFGTNFSGGSTATCEIFSRLEHHFNGVKVIGTELGDHPFQSLEFIPYNNWWEGIKAIKKFAHDGVVFYGDFYNAFLFVLAGVSFFFTYHDNWPEMGQFGIRNRIRSLFYTTIYTRIFRKASHVFSVSEFKEVFIRRFTNRVSLVRNGFSKKNGSYNSGTGDVLMVGNIDHRKYTKAVEFFRYLEERVSDTVRIDIYGRLIDKELVRELSRFNFVNIRGFEERVPYGNYKFLLHTSLMENLPITFCEALDHRLPVVAFDVGGSSEIIGEKQGILTRPYQLEGLYQAFMRLVNDDQTQTFQLQVPSEFSWDYCSERYYERLANHKAN